MVSSEPQIQICFSKTWFLRPLYLLFNFTLCFIFYNLLLTTCFNFILSFNKGFKFYNFYYIKLFLSFNQNLKNHNYFFIKKNNQKKINYLLTFDHLRIVQQPKKEESFSSPCTRFYSFRSHTYTAWCFNKAFHYFDKSSFSIFSLVNIAVSFVSVKNIFYLTLL